MTHVDGGWQSLTKPTLASGSTVAKAKGQRRVQTKVTAWRALTVLDVAGEAGEQMVSW